MSTHPRSWRWMTRFARATAACGFALAGCNEAVPQPPAGDAAPLQQQQQPQPSAQPTIRANLFPTDVKTIQSDAVPGVTFLVQINAYKITLPVGAVSRNDDFWNLGPMIGVFRKGG